MPGELIMHHVNAIQAIFREQTRINASGMADQLSKRLRGVADEYSSTSIATGLSISKPCLRQASCRKTETFHDVAPVSRFAVTLRCR